MGTLPRVVLSVVLVAGLSGCGKPSKEECERFTDHMVELSTKKAKEIMGDDDAARTSAEESRKDFQEKCETEISSAEYNCAISAKNFDELSGC